MKNLISYLEYNLSEFTESEKIIAKYFIEEHDVDELKIVDVAERLYVSTATISRFVNKIGYDNYKAFIHEYNYALAENSQDSIVVNQEARNIWNIHNQFYNKLYRHFETIDLNYIANRINSAKNVYTFGFGRTQDAMNMIIYRFETITQKMRSVNHYEHLLYLVEEIMNHESLIIFFYYDDEFYRQMQRIIKLAENRYVPLIIISLQTSIESTSNSAVYNLYPYKDDTISKYSTTMYVPFLLFIDGLFLVMNRKKSETRLDYF